jgi:hypothetical protein
VFGFTAWRGVRDIAETVINVGAIWTCVGQIYAVANFTDCGKRSWFLSNRRLGEHKT